jgi:hypothetical protein
MTKRLVCWNCGASLKSVPLPISRLARCLACRTDLHVCRLCRSYNPRVSGYCGHDLAEPARDPECANFCQYFKPKPGAYVAREYQEAETARTQLEALFGDSETQDSNAPRGEAEAPSTADRAREELEKLFGGGR